MVDERGAAVARGEHPQRTPVYGGLLIIAAMIGASLVWLSRLPGALKAVLLVVALVAALAGWLMTFRDLSNPRRKR
jgi:UDP-N-acetylmuramyl pentapeptide phosphotransferase/UDP-N-acetylglucosamine-1-phosphate transferase